MHKSIRRFGITAVAVLLAGCTRHVQTTAEQVQPARDSALQLPSTPMPPTELLDLNGEQRNIFGDPSTKVVVVVFTRSDCPISNRNAPEIIQLCSKYQKQAVRIFLVYVDPRESAEAIRTHLRDYRYPCEAIRDPRHVLVKQTGATVTPEAVVFDAGRRIAYRGRINDLYVELGKSRPRATRHDLDDAIAAALLDQRVTRPVTEPIGCYIEDLE